MVMESLHLFLLHQTKVGNLRWNFTSVITWVILSCVFSRNSREQEHGTLVFVGTSTINLNVSMVVRPISWCRNRLLVRKLKGLNTTYNLVHVTTYACRVVKGEHQLVLRVDNEDCADGQWQGLLITCSRINHSIHG